MAISTSRFALPKLLWSLVLVFATVGLGMAAVHGVGAGPDHALTADTSNVALSDDDSGAAMFNLSGMAPGDRATRCVRVEYSGAGSPAVNLYGNTTGSGLDQHLRMTVEAGQGGGFDSCDGFQGAPIYEGTLADFTRDHSSLEQGLPTHVGTSEDHARSFRFHLELVGGNEAQGQDTTASFIWETNEASDGAKPEPTPADSPPAASPPGPAPQTGTARAPAAKPKAQPHHQDKAAPPVDITPAQPHAKDSGGGESLVGKALRDVVKAAKVVAPRGAAPLLLFLIVLAFLAIQDRIDRRDPKLALAPLSDEPYLSFGNPREDAR